MVYRGELGTLGLIFEGILSMKKIQSTLLPTLLSLLILTSALVLTVSCGLPASSSVAAPIFLNTNNYPNLASANTTSTTLLAFQMPNDGNITGYNIYYELYDSASQVLEQKNDKQQLEDQFISLDANDEIFIGNKLVNSLGFKRAELTSNDRNESNFVIISHRSNSYVYLYFYGTATGGEQESFLLITTTPPNSLDLGTTTLTSSFLGRSVYHTDPNYGSVNRYKSFYEKYKTSDADLNSTIRGGSSSTRMIANFAVIAKASPALTNSSDSQAKFIGSVDNILRENKNISSDSKI